MSYEHMDLRGEARRGAFKFMYETPVSGKTSIRVSLPLVDLNATDLSGGFELGDVSIRLTHLFTVSPKYSVVL